MITFIFLSFQRNAIWPVNVGKNGKNGGVGVGVGVGAGVGVGVGVGDGKSGGKNGGGVGVVPQFRGVKDTAPSLVLPGAA